MSRFNPCPKPVKQENKNSPGQWIGGRFVQLFKKKKDKKKPLPQKYRTSSGELLSQTQIDRRLSKAYQDNLKPSDFLCECCGEERAVDRDHTLSQRRCKILKLTELIWDWRNWSLSCRNCHTEWESYKSGLFKKHLNYECRMAYLKKASHEDYQKRINV